MLARARTFTIEGLDARPVTVEVDIRSGLPAFTIVGLADVAVREARERVRAAILNSGFSFPASRITANLAPADLPKIGPGIDLALACAVLAASRQIPAETLDSHALFGELSLDGTLRPCSGTLAVAEAALAAGLRTLIVASGRAREARLIHGLRVGVSDSLASAVRVLHGGEPDRVPDIASAAGATSSRRSHTPDLADVRGQQEAVRALIVAAAGGHNCLLSGPPGAGKTMLAQRLPSILPPLTRAEAIEVTRIHSVSGDRAVEELLRDRPFRAPHHTITTAGLIGGARRGWVGEVVLAHRGVLFLDELSEFARPTLEALRQPVEDGRVAIVRARHSAVYPARFMLVGATNPCPCGYAGDEERCRCSEAAIDRYRRRLSGPLLDRIDMLVNMRRGDAYGVSAPALTSSDRARERVLQARERQRARLHEVGIALNAHMDARTAREHARLDSASERALESACERGALSARGAQRVLRLARTLADLAGSERVGPSQIDYALALRPEAARQARWAA
jgi:magnesium chelatase family protein